MSIDVLGTGEQARPLVGHVLGVDENVEITVKGEDGEVLDTEHCIATLDGVTTHGEPPINGMSPGAFVVSVGKAALLEASSLTCSNREFREQLARILTERIREALPTDRTFKERPSFVFVAYFPERNLVVRAGDCSMLIDGHEHPDMPNKGIRADVRKHQMRAWLKRRGRDPKEVDAKTRAWQQKHANKQGMFGYPLANGTPIPEDILEAVSLPPGTHEIVLATDGAWQYALRGTYAGSDGTEAAMRATTGTADDLTYIHFKVEVR